MKVHLMFRDHDAGLTASPVAHHQALTQDLELDTLFAAMAHGDEFVLQVVKATILRSLSSAEDIRYRQDILADCMARPDITRSLYALAVEAIEREKKVWKSRLNRYPESDLRRSVDVLGQFVVLLKQLRDIARSHASQVHSEGFSRLFAMMARELDEAYISLLEDHLRRLALRGHLAMSADLSNASGPSDYTLHKSCRPSAPWIAQLQGWVQSISNKEPESYVYQIPERDESGLNALTELRGRGLSRVAAALDQATEHVLSFFVMLRAELGFYVGCLNLEERLREKTARLCRPVVDTEAHTWSATDLYDISLMLSARTKAVGNDVNADGKSLIMITGANRGGKSTFLRSVGQAHLMMQCGMYVAAESFRATLYDGIFTHFRREEDSHMKSGKLDEELKRMSALVDQLTSRSMVLFNESFAATNPREAAEIGTQIVQALLETGMKVVYVTHLFDLSMRFYKLGSLPSLFLRAERLEDGSRTFRIREGEPLATSYGEDLYRRLFQLPSKTAPPSLDG